MRITCKICKYAVIYFTFWFTIYNYYTLFIKFNQITSQSELYSSWVALSSVLIKFWTLVTKLIDEWKKLNRYLCKYWFLPVIVKAYILLKAQPMAYFGGEVRNLRLDKFSNTISFYQNICDILSHITPEFHKEWHEMNAFYTCFKLDKLIICMKNNELLREKYVDVTVAID